MKKLKSKAGFTLTEVLISLIIITMGVVLFSGMTQATGSVVAKQSNFRTDLINQDQNLEKNIKNPPTMGSQQATTINVSITGIKKKPVQGTMIPNFKDHKSNIGTSFTENSTMTGNYTVPMALVNGDSQDKNVGNIYAYTLFKGTANP